MRKLCRHANFLANGREIIAQRLEPADEVNDYSITIHDPVDLIAPNRNTEIRSILQKFFELNKLATRPYVMRMRRTLSYGDIPFDQTAPGIAHKCKREKLGPFLITNLLPHPLANRVLQFPNERHVTWFGQSPTDRCASCLRNMHKRKTPIS